MARKNRVSVYDGVYHVTTRIANRAMLLKPEEVKRKLQEIILDVVTLESVFADGLPDGITPEQVKEWFDDYDEDARDANGNPRCPPPIYRASQVIRVTLKAFARGAYVGRDFAFLMRVKGLLPDRFPAAGRRSIKRCRAFIWELPDATLLQAA